MGLSLKQWLVVVPARLGSTRLPRKPLADLGGLPLIVRVVRNLLPLERAGAEIVVATDSEEVMSVASEHGIKAIKTRPDHPSGTDRCAEVARAKPQTLVLNVQGDEPFVDTQDLLSLCKAMEARPHADIGTLVYKTRDAALIADPHAVKAVRGHDGFALYFSRAPIPYRRDASTSLPEAAWQHLGVYAFKRERLAAFATLAPSELERTENLEQLRALESGWRIYLEPASSACRGIDTPEDLEAARARF